MRLLETQPCSVLGKWSIVLVLDLWSVVKPAFYPRMDAFYVLWVSLDDRFLQETRSFILTITRGARARG